MFSSFASRVLFIWEYFSIAETRKLCGIQLQTLPAVAISRVWTFFWTNKELIHRIDWKPRKRSLC